MAFIQFVARFRVSQRQGYFAIAAFTLLLALSYLTLDRLAPAGKRLAKIAGIDTVGYFGTAHSLLFDHDFNLNNEYERVPPMDRLLTPNQKETGLPANHWPIGYSLLAIPFLGAGTLIDVLVGNPGDGYSQFALYGYGLCNIVLTGIGLFFLFRLLCEAGRTWGFPDSRSVPYALLVTFATFFGSNVGYYSFAQLSHASTALFSALFLYYWWKMRSSEDVAAWFLLGIAGGFLSICRWQDGVFLLGPVLYDLMGKDRTRKLLPWLRTRAFYAAAVVLCWIPQLMEWKAIFGKYLTNPFQANYSTFPPPHVWQVLASSQNGWLLWTPLILPGLAGLFYGAFRFFRLYSPWIVVLTIEILLVGSLSFWHGIDSFSSRYLTTTVPLASLGLFTLLCVSGEVWRKLLTAVVVACCVFSVLFAVQLRFNLIPSNETLTPKEILTDKLHLPRVRKQKVAVTEARRLIETGDTRSAIPILEQAASLGDDRDVLALLARAYRLNADQERAGAADRELRLYLDTKLN